MLLENAVQDTLSLNKVSSLGCDRKIMQNNAAEALAGSGSGASC